MWARGVASVKKEVECLDVRRLRERQRWGLISPFNSPAWTATLWPCLNNCLFSHHRQLYGWGQVCA